MQECVFPVPDVDKCGIEPRHHFSDLTDQDVAYGEIVVGFLMLEFYEFAILQEGKFNAGFSSIDNQFFIHDGNKVCHRHVQTTE
jgi:hypothetical protein